MHSGAIKPLRHRLFRTRGLCRSDPWFLTGRPETSRRSVKCVYVLRTYSKRRTNSLQCDLNDFTDRREVPGRPDPARGLAAGNHRPSSQAGRGTCESALRGADAPAAAPRMLPPPPPVTRGVRRAPVRIIPARTPSSCRQHCKCAGRPSVTHGRSRVKCLVSTWAHRRFA